MMRANRKCGWVGIIIYLISFYCVSAQTRTVSIITPQPTEQTTEIRSHLTDALNGSYSILSGFMSDSIFSMEGFSNPFNLSVDEARNAGIRIGANYFLLVRSETQRRTDFTRDRYFESYLAIYVVSSRTGELRRWIYKKFERDSFDEAYSNLKDSIPEIASEIKASIEKAEQSETATEDFTPSSFDEKAIQPARPYSRIKPEYTTLAAIYHIIATIDVLIDVDENGSVKAIEVRRWAGYGLEESVKKAIEQMTWRPASINGRFLRTKVLVRYNFKEIGKED
ncbi:MAG: energy transducer TonB [Pyrinomonadaceae bacterium]